jgi:hypothetical protein
LGEGRWEGTLEKKVVETSEGGVDVVAILMQKYSLLRQEVWLHIGYFKGHIAKFQLMGSALLAAGAYILSNSKLYPSSENWWVWWLGTTIVPVMCHYLIFDIIESQYAMILLGERLATLEEEINEKVGRQLLIWESLVSPLFWQGLRPMPGVINPDWFLSLFGFIIASFDAVAVPSLLYSILWKDRDPHSLGMCAAIFCGVGLMVFSMGASLYCAWRVLLRMRGKPRVLFRRMASHNATSGIV